MRTRLSKVDGITLVELLAAMAILSFLIVLTYGVLVKGFDFSKSANAQVSIQQEMNIMTSTITKLHETETTYDIILDGNPNAGKVQFIGKNADGTTDKTIIFSNSDYQYSLYIFKGNVDTPLLTIME
jgi:prepilin-type N-terminal cleavage/methylation domain-containing protein